MPKITENISRNLSAWMAESPRLDTLKKVSIASKVGFGTVQRAKNGDGNPTVLNLFDIARAFGRPIEDLFATPGEESRAYKPGTATKLAAKEKPTPQELQAEIVAHLSEMDTDDMEVWIATVKAAANKARRKKQEEISKVDNETTHSPPPSERKRTA